MSNEENIDDKTRNKEDQGVEHKSTQITGRTEGPYYSDGTDEEIPYTDNRHRDSEENRANGMDSMQIRGGQDGRNNRPMGGIDMDSANGVLRFNDIENNGPQDITEEGLDQAARTNTSMVDVTTSGPDDYASAEDVPTPAAEEAAKAQEDGDTNSGDTRSNSLETQESEEEEIARTGTSTSHEPTY